MIREVDQKGTIWFYEDERLHREDGHAIEFPDGSKAWVLNGCYHRLDGPAIERASGYRAWYINGINYSEEEYRVIAFSLGKPI